MGTEIEKMGWSKLDIMNMSFNAIQSSFTTNEIKRKLRNKLEIWYAKYDEKKQQQQRNNGNGGSMGSSSSKKEIHHDLFHYNDRVHYD